VGKVVKLLVVVAVLAGVAWFAVQQFSGSTEPAGGAAADAKKPRLEEKYGYTSEGVGR
jgi:hypothetical protein